MWCILITSNSSIHTSPPAIINLFSGLVRLYMVVYCSLNKPRENRANARWKNIEKWKIIGFSTRNRGISRTTHFCRIKTAAIVSSFGICRHTDSSLENWNERDWLFFWIYCAFSLPYTRFWWTHFGLRASEESSENEEPQNLASQASYF